MAADSQRKPCYDQLALMASVRLHRRPARMRWRKLGWGPLPAGFHEGCQRPVEIQLGPFRRLPWSPPTATPSLPGDAQAIAEPLGWQVSFRAQALPQLTGSGAHRCTTRSGGHRRPQPLQRPRGELPASRHWRTTSWPACWRHAPALCAINQIPTPRAMRGSGPDPPSPAPPGRRAGSVMAATNRSTWCASRDQPALELRTGRLAPPTLPCLPAGGAGRRLDVRPGAAARSWPRQRRQPLHLPALRRVRLRLPAKSRRSPGRLRAGTVAAPALGGTLLPRPYESLRRQHGCRPQQRTA